MYSLLARYFLMNSKSFTEGSKGGKVQWELRINPKFSQVVSTRKHKRGDLRWTSVRINQ